LNAARVVVLLLNIVAMLSLMPRTIGPSVARTVSSAILASTHPVFAAETAATALRTDVMNVTAWAAVNVWPATMKTAFGQNFGMPSTSAWRSETVSVWVGVLDMVFLSLGVDG
jgi:hypothetical protein